MQKFVQTGRKMKEGKTIVPGGQAKSEEKELISQAAGKSEPSPEPDATQTNLPEKQSESPASEDNGDYVNPWDLKKLKLLDNTLNWQEMWNPRHSMSITHTKGLLNAPGENNCFLNSAVQVLWHLDVFRRSFRSLTGHACMGNSCIFCALKVIFTQFQFSDRSALPPDALRKALAKTFADQQRFQLGLMDDAAECFENILMRIHFHLAHDENEDMCNARHCIPHQKFTMRMLEQTQCSCGATSEPHPFNQMVHYVSTSALVTQARTAADSNYDVSFGHLLRCAISQGDYRNCPSECGRTVQLKRNLLNAPDIVSLGLVWDSDRPSSLHISDVVRAIGTTVKLNQLFHTVSDDRWADANPLHLVGVVCYYGKHYSTFLFHSKMKTWVSFDDANVKEMGNDWREVVDKCCRGHYQPLLLLYANPNASIIDNTTALQKPIMLPGHQFNNNNDSTGSSQGGPSPSASHTRQRSGDGSGTMGGRSAYNFETSLREGARRAITPTPDGQKTVTPARRARTPGPDWGRYNSDDEELNDNKDGIAHCRQPSYIFAVDGDEAPCTCDSNNQQLYVGGQEPSAAKPASQDSVNNPPRDGSYSVREQERRSNYVAHGHEKGTDLLGSLPNQRPQESQVNIGYQTYNGGASNYSQSAYYSQQQPQQQQYYTQAQYQAMERNRSNFVNPSAPVSTASSVARVNEIQKTDPYGLSSRSYGQSVNQNYPVYSSAGQRPYTQSTGYSVPPAHTQAVQSNVAKGILDANPSMMNPALKRSKSMENGELLSGQAQPQRNPVSRNRPASARPYDYPNGRPVVEQKPSQPTRTRTCSEGNGLDEADGDFPVRENSAPTGYNQHPGTHPSGKENMGDDHDMYGTYISRKTVKNILHYQGIGKHNATPTMPVQANTDPVSQGGKKSWQQNDFLRDLKVDIPDNASIGSHKDSGYRSGGSSGDRNSASSTSSVSMESPNLDHYTRGYPPSSYKPPQHTQHHQHTQHGMGHADNRSHSSTESLSSTQSGHSYSTVKTVPGQQRLGKIPENISSAYKYADKSQSAENLLDPKGGKPFHKLSQDNLLAHAHQQPAKQPLSGDDHKAERLFMEAENLLEHSAKKEQAGDYHMAMVMCNKAIGELQQALGLRGAAQETLVRVRMKHNTSIMRSRKLHKQIMQRQTSTGSNLSSEDRTSISSGSSETSGHNLINLDPKQPYQQLQEQVNEIYSRQPSNSSGSSSSSSGYPGHHQGMVRSSTDGGLSQAARQGPRVADGFGKEESSPERQVNIYGTLPRPGKPVPNDTNQEPEVYQAYHELKTRPEPYPVQHGPPSKPNHHPGIEVSHQRQWSKEEIREVLLKDYVSAREKGTAGKKPQIQPKPKPQPQTTSQPKPQPAGSIDDMLCRQVQSMAVRDQRQQNPAAASHPPQQKYVQPQTNPAHNYPQQHQPHGYLQQYPGPAQPGQQSQQPNSQQLQQSRKPLPTYEQHQQRYSNGLRTDLMKGPHPNVNYTRGDPAPSQTFPGRPVPTGVQGYPNQQPKQQQQPQGSEQWQASNGPNYAQHNGYPNQMNAAYPAGNVPQGQASYDPKSDVLRPQLSNNLPGSTNGATTTHSTSINERAGNKARFVPCPVAPSLQNGEAAPPGVEAATGNTEEAWPPPPPECLDVIGTSSVRYGDKPQTSCTTAGPGELPPDAAVTVPASLAEGPGSGCQCGGKAGEEACACGPSLSDNPALTPTKVTPTKPSLVKKKKKGKSRKERRSVTFSDNVALISTPEDLPEQVDYMAIIHKMLERRKDKFGASSLSSLSSGSSYSSSQPSSSISSDSPKPARKHAADGNDSDFDEHLSDSECSSETSAQNAINERMKTDKVRCSLCRRKFITVADMYCRDCTHYMSKLQPSPAS